MNQEEEEIAHEEGHDEPWLVSYADLMTLLFGFFVLMYTFASAKIKDEDENMEKVRKELTQYFGGQYITPYEMLADNFKRGLQGTDLGNSIAIKTTPEGLLITMQSTTLFPSGSAALYPKSIEVLKNLSVMLLEKSRTLKVIVEGHTDDEPIRKSSSFPSNWELSGARASSVIRIFEEAGFERTLLSAIGYADTRPEMPNRGANGIRIPENMSRNRRVIIKVAEQHPDSP